jgi:hypothetical protein
MDREVSAIQTANVMPRSAFLADRRIGVVPGGARRFLDRPRASSSDRKPRPPQPADLILLPKEPEESLLVPVGDSR